LGLDHVLETATLPPKQLVSVYAQADPAGISLNGPSV
jgi:hypothetical protein